MSYQILRLQEFKSKKLKRTVIFDLAFPVNMKANLPLLLMNDGQDFDQLNIPIILQNHSHKLLSEFVYCGIHTTEQRMQEYGTSGIMDYKKRGQKAGKYMEFVIHEFLPFLRAQLVTSAALENNIIAGFSLGGLSAFDIAWENNTIFGKIGVFSGSFWWRSKGYQEGFTEDNDRIMHNKIKATLQPNLNQKFWLECGTNDEKADRNNNGIIDAIDDTTDIINELKAKGFGDSNIDYVEVKDGEHNFNTWRLVFPEFLEWGLG